jgi:hypothetical protein
MVTATFVTELLHNIPAYVSLSYTKNTTPKMWGHIANNQTIFFFICENSTNDIIIFKMIFYQRKYNNYLAQSLQICFQQQQLIVAHIYHKVFLLDRKQRRINSNKSAIFIQVVSELHQRAS